MDRIIQIILTGDTEELLEGIGKHLVEKQLVACAQIGGPIKSIYRWRGQIEEAREWTCTLKTTRNLYCRVEAEIKSLHPYETPEIVAFEIVEALPEYRDWVTEETVG